MKEFFKWLGVNEKVAKVVVWLMIIAVMLIIFNTAFESLGLPYYKVTVDNLKNINYGKVADYLSSWIATILEFFAISFLVFRISKFKDIIKWAFLYWFLNLIINNLFGYIFVQVFIFLYIVLFYYFFSGKNKKYILYSIYSYILVACIQTICYYYKYYLISHLLIGKFTRVLLFFDYLILLFVFILIKEYFLKKKEVD